MWPAPTTEADMNAKVFEYIDRIFALVRPRKLVYMAIDGVAPRAKMNQQRSRRFRSAQEAEELEEDAEAIRKNMTRNGHKPPPQKNAAWDSNVITPGTDFMATLADWLRFYIVDRMNKHKAWKNVKVILSDAQSPGEGEHKIMQFIRRQRAHPGHDPNTHHVLYGLDADLIMLGLATHEVHFTILREQVLFGKKRRNQQGRKLDPVLFDGAHKKLSKSKGKPFVLLSLPILREYLQVEFSPSSFYQRLPFQYDFERCLDDFVFLCFFVGNDFLPHLPSLSIREGALELLIDIYKRILPVSGGYFTNSGSVNLSRVEMLMKMLGSAEDEIFKRRATCEALQKRRRQNSKRSRNDRERNGAMRVVDQARAVGRVAKRGKRSANDAPSAEAMKLAFANVKSKTRIPTQSENANAAAALRASISVGGIPGLGGSVPGLGVASSTTTSSSSKAQAEEPKLSEEDAKKQFDEELKERTKKRTFHDDVPDHVQLGTRGWKDRYYVNKFGDEGKDGSLRRRVVESYVVGLCWVLQYYYKGCQSWKWFSSFTTLHLLLILRT